MEIKPEENLPDVLKSGPYQTVIITDTLKIPKGSWGNSFELKVFISSPKRTSSVPPRSVPLVLMFNGFQLPAAYYTAYRHAFSSWGYVALSYDVPNYVPGVPIKRVITDDAEIELIRVLLDWVREQSLDPASAIYEILDVGRVAGFGHSRGAKIAALALAGDRGLLQAAVLVDPVDLTSQTRGRKGYPSAVDKLLSNPKQALIIGAGVRGRCNPEDEGWAKFWPAVHTSSWLHVLRPAGHMQFLDVDGIASWAFDQFCGTGKITQKEVINLVQGAAVAWVQQYFRPDQSEQLVTRYLSWIVKSEQLALIDWEIKQDNPNLPLRAQSDAPVELLVLAQ